MPVNLSEADSAAGKMRGMPYPRRKWNCIPVEEIEQSLFGSGIPLEHWFVYGDWTYGCWLNGETLLMMDDNDAFCVACMRYLKAHGAPHYPSGTDIPKSPPAPGRQAGGNRLA